MFAWESNLIVIVFSFVENVTSMAEKYRRKKCIMCTIGMSIWDLINSPFFVGEWVNIEWIRCGWITCICCLPAKWFCQINFEVLLRGLTVTHLGRDGPDIIWALPMNYLLIFSTKYACQGLESAYRYAMKFTNNF